MKELVLSVGQALHLQELGLDMSDAKLAHNAGFGGEVNPIVENREECLIASCGHLVPTYTLEEIWEKLPDEIMMGKRAYDLCINKNSIDYVYKEYDYWEACFSSSKDSMLEMAYDALYFIVKNKPSKYNS